MRLLSSWSIPHRQEERKIELFWGDLSMIPREQAVDILVVSAFSNDYLPTPTSLIGALDRNGVSVAHLARDKQKDLREEFSCWLSHPVFGASGYKRILCIESGWRGAPPEITDDIFRALAPCSVLDFPNGSVAMPLIGAGDQGYGAGEMMSAILRAAVSWFRRGLNLRVLKIVAYSDADASKAQKAFVEMKNEDAVSARPGDASTAEPAPNFDVFLSYAHEDIQLARGVVNLLKNHAPGLRIFFDRQVLSPGSSWVLDIADSLDGSRLIAPIYTSTYWTKKYCKDEFAAAYIRQNDTGRSVLFPFYVQSTRIPALFRTVQFADCRESDNRKIQDACKQLCEALVP